MLLFPALDALAQEIRTCMGGNACEYAVHVSRGMPSADCNSIAVWYGGSSKSDSDSSDCETWFDSFVNVTITRCCMQPDAEEVYDPARENSEAQCFLEDLTSLRNCLYCNATAIMDPFVDGCSAQIANIDVDNEAEGGCYSSTITFSVLERDCCPPPAPPPS